MNRWITKSGYTIIQVMSGRSNVFLLKCKNNLYLIDTSTRGNWEKLDNTLKTLDINRIDYIILTHTHHDHAANAKRVKDKYQASVIVHQDEALTLLNGQAKLPQGTNFFTKALIHLLGKKLEPKFNFEPCPYDILVSSSIYDMREVGLNVYILHTPGHSMGSISLIIDDEIAIVGDAMFGVFKKNIFPPYADDPELLINSWKKLLSTPCKLFLPAHGSVKNADQLEKGYRQRLSQK